MPAPGFVVDTCGECRFARPHSGPVGHDMHHHELQGERMECRLDPPYIISGTFPNSVRDVAYIPVQASTPACSRGLPVP